MRGVHSTSHLTTIISGAEALPCCLAWQDGRAEISRRHINRTPLAWRVCGGPGTTPTPMAARVWVAQGKLDEALEWTLERGLTVADDLSYLREFEHLTLARVLLGRGSFVDAMGLLERLLRAADDGARTGSVVEILVLQAMANQMRGDLPAALVSLERALSLAEPEGYVRIFVDEGSPMAA